MKIVECKLEAPHPALLEGALRRMGATFITCVDQRDTYFRAPDGRLLRREYAHGPAEWLFFHRRHLARPRVCSAVCYSDAAAHERFGMTPLPVWVRVEKRRRTWWKDGLRVNLDDLGPLGTFVELETRIGARGDAESCFARIREARAAFAPLLGEAIGVGYADLAALAVEIDREIALP